MRVLIVDDHELIRRGIRDVLESLSHEVCGEAADGQEGVTKAISLKPDIIFMDVSMPKLNGFDATREILRFLPEAKVVMVTQYDCAEIVRQALKAGARGYVLKSALSNQLVQAIDGLYRYETTPDVDLTRDSTVKVDGQEIPKSVALEKALQESEDLFRLTFEYAPVGIGHVTPDGRWLRVNPKLCEIVGFTESEMLSLNHHDITHPDDRTAERAYEERLLTGEAERYALKKRYLRKDGSSVWVARSVWAVRDLRKRVKYLIAITEDTTERSEPFDTPEQPSHVQLVGKTLPLAICRCGPPRRYEWANQKYAEVLRVPLDRIIGSVVEGSVGGHSLVHLRSQLKRVLSVRP